MPLTRAASAPTLDVLAVGVRWSRRIVLVTVVLALLATWLPAPVHDLFVLALVAAGLVAGLPHGSVDHRLAAGLTGWSTPTVAALYAAVAAVTWVLLATAGLWVLVPVVVLSLAHFALGELECVRDTTGWRPGRVVALSVAVAGTGALLLPLARSGPQLASVAASISPELGVLLADGVARIALASLWLLAAAVAAAAALRARQYGVVADLALVAALGALAPPLVAFAVWFGGWHAVRHCARLLTVDERAAVLVAQGRTRQAVRTLARVAAAPTAAAIVVLAGLLLVTTNAAHPAAAVGSTLLVLLALTVPHMLVVLWLDHRGVTAPRA